MNHMTLRLDIMTLRPKVMDKTVFQLRVLLPKKAQRSKLKKVRSTKFSHINKKKFSQTNSSQPKFWR